MMEKSWKDVKLRQLQEINDLPEYEDKIDLIINTLSILLDKDPADIENMEINKIYEEFSKWDFLNDKPEGKLVPIVKIGKREYGICDLSKITMAQLTDLEEYISEGVMKNLHKVLSIIYLPIKKKKWFGKGYELEKYVPSDERKNDFLEATMDVIYPTALFFYNGVTDYLRDLAHSSVERKKEEMKKMISQEVGLSEEVKNELLKKLEKSGIGFK